MAANDVYQVTIIGNLNGQTVNNVLHYRENVGETHAIPAEAVARGWFHDNSASWLACISDAYAVAGVYARRVKPTPGIPYLHIPAAGHEGLRASPAASTTACGVISLYSETFSRRGRGRIYMPGVPEDGQDNGIITDELREDYITFAERHVANFLGWDGTAATSGSWTGSIYSRANGTDALAVAFTVNNPLGTIRGRRAPIAPPIATP